MANKFHGKQYTFRINFDNPDHLKVYRTLEDLNLNIHKSVSNFVIKALIAYINGADHSELTNQGLKNNQKEIVTKDDLDEMKKEIRIEVLKEVAMMINDMNINNQRAINMSVLQQIMNNPAEITNQKLEREEGKTDAALEEMSVLFSRGGFGEE